MNFSVRASDVGSKKKAKGWHCGLACILGYVVPLYDKVNFVVFNWFLVYLGCFRDVVN